MILEHFLLSVNETNSYVLACTDTGEAALIDPGEWNEQIAGFISEQKLSLKWVLLTHGHSDHVGGVGRWQAGVKGLQVAAHRLYPGADRLLADGDTIQIGKLTVRVLEVPGHTQDSLAFVIGCDVLCGDALFAGSIGGTADQQSFQQLVRSIREKLFTLGDDIVLHPGHGPATTVQIERLFNPFFNL